MKLRVLIADDEAPARKEMRRLLASHADVEIVAEASDGDEAVEMIRRHDPDLVFLDIRMPGRDGFSVLDELEPPMPEIIFSTAYDQFAVDAIRRGALDYLLKPVAPEDLAAALQRARERLAARGANPREPGRLGPGDRAYFRDGKRAFLFEVDKILWLESEGNYTRVVTATDRPLVRHPIKYFESRLDAAHFFRISRTRIAGLDHVQGTRPIPGGKILLDYGEGKSLEVSRRQARVFQRKFAI